MGTLREVKKKMKSDRDLRKTLVRGARNEILIDLDGGGQPDVALMDTTGNGDIDTLAVDLNGDGAFNLCFHDADANGLPDIVLLDSEGNSIMEILGVGPELEAELILAGHTVLSMLVFGDYAAASLYTALGELEQEVKEARRSLQEWG